jgi:hypothetical protein
VNSLDKLNATCQAKVVFPWPLEDFITVILFSIMDFSISFSKFSLLIGKPFTISAGAAFLPS